MRKLIYSILILAAVLTSFPVFAAGPAGYEVYLPEGLDIDIILEPSDVERIGGNKKTIFQLNEAGEPTLLLGETFLTLKSSEGDEVIPPFRVEGAGSISHYAWMPDGTLMIISGKVLGILTTEGFMPILKLPHEDMKIEPASDDLCYLYGGSTKEQQRRLYLLKKGGMLLHLLEADEPVTAVAGDGKTTFIASGGSVLTLRPGETEIMYTAGEEIGSLTVSKETGGIFFATVSSAGYIHGKETGFEFIKGVGAEVKTFNDSIYIYFPDGEMFKVSPVSLFGETAETAAGRPEGITGYIKEVYATAAFLLPFLLPYMVPYCIFVLVIGKQEFTMLDTREIEIASRTFWVIYGIVAVIAVMGAHPTRLQGALWTSGTLLGILLFPYLLTDLMRRFSDMLNSVLRGFLFPPAAWLSAVILMTIGLFVAAISIFVFMDYISMNMFSFTERAFNPEDLLAAFILSLLIPFSLLLVKTGLRMFRPPAREYFSAYFEAYRANRIKTLFGGGKLIYLILSLVLWEVITFIAMEKAERFTFSMMFDQVLPALVIVLLCSCAGMLVWNTGLFFYRIARPEAEDRLTFWHKASIGLSLGIIAAPFI